MCIGMPMQVLATREGFAQVAGRGEQREVNTALVGPVQPGDWLLVFLDTARECIDAARAAEVDATLDLVQAAMAGVAPDPLREPGFSLPSAMTAEQLAALAGG
ncbi:HypC/HybG/HupF family hydrogenase formation chaperone [Aquabacterium sp. OR-4]|uniref:HypC/HybG/HupF family hydrogenase formation chaperone n=1 Tax=Aquabacterium sp. OR-4 TaxID=2978127 RepID=UPI0021B4BA90|nr:HypC/HybG/HupF family hydrogenase formation chaperone [Aquabacterium sp. OR-4]MDT7833627.1 HypC/HybG/HupF family hydrogenase formation chaperone [Aquabacterium sp. OR-4]